MPRHGRSLRSEYYFHVTNRSVRRAPLFLRPHDYRGFLAILREGLERHPVKLVAYCVMSNHWHLILGPTGTQRLSKLLHWVTTTHAVRLRRHRKTVGLGPVYTGRFKSRAIETSGHLLTTIRYVERNALAAKLVRRAQDWPWCSLAERLRATGTLPLKGAQFLSSDAWVRHVNSSYRFEDDELRPVPEVWIPVEKRRVPLRDRTKVPGARKGFSEGGEIRRRAGDHETDAHVERAKHFRLIKLSRALQPLEQRRNRPAAAIK